MRWVGARTKRYERPLAMRRGDRSLVANTRLLHSSQGENPFRLTFFIPVLFANGFAVLLLALVYKRRRLFVSENRFLLVRLAAFVCTFFLQVRGGEERKMRVGARTEATKRCEFHCNSLCSTLTPFLRRKHLLLCDLLRSSLSLSPRSGLYTSSPRWWSTWMVTQTSCPDFTSACSLSVALRTTSFGALGLAASTSPASAASSRPQASTRA